MGKKCIEFFKCLFYFLIIFVPVFYFIHINNAGIVILWLIAFFVYWVVTNPTLIRKIRLSNLEITLEEKIKEAEVTLENLRTITSPLFLQMILAAKSIGKFASNETFYKMDTDILSIPDTIKVLNFSLEERKRIENDVYNYFSKRQKDYMASFNNDCSYDKLKNWLNEYEANPSSEKLKEIYKYPTQINEGTENEVVSAVKGYLRSADFCQGKL